MVKAYALTGILAVSACGGDVRVTDGDGGAAQGGTNAPGAGSAQGGTDAQGAGDPQGGSGSEPPVVWPGQTFSTVYCSGGVTRLYVEIWPDNAATEACLPSASIDPSQVLVIVIDDWDFGAGTFPLNLGTEHGVASAGYASGPANATGSITLEPYSDAPAAFSWDLDFSEGSTDLALCFQPLAEPCTL